MFQKPTFTFVIANGFELTHFKCLKRKILDSATLPKFRNATESARLCQHRNGREELLHIQGKEQSCLRSGAVTERSYPTSR